MAFRRARPFGARDAYRAAEVPVNSIQARTLAAYELLLADAAFWHYGDAARESSSACQALRTW